MGIDGSIKRHSSRTIYSRYHIESRKLALYGCILQYQGVKGLGNREKYFYSNISDAQLERICSDYYNFISFFNCL